MNAQTLLMTALILVAGFAASASGDDATENWQSAYETSLREAGFPVFKAWEQVGPFDPILRRPMAPEESPDEESYPLFRGKSAGWTSQPDYRDGYVNKVDLSRIDPEVLKAEPTVCLGRTIQSESDREITVYLGADAGFSLWLNGEPVFYTETIAEFIPGQEKATLSLKKGRNRLVFKLKIAAQPSRFFFTPELGTDDALMSRLHAEHPQDRSLIEGYREKARLLATATEDEYYPMEEIPVPEGVFLEGGGMDFLPDGRLAVSTRRGYVYLVSNLESRDPSKAAFHRFAQGLHEGLGLKVVDSQIHVVERGGLTRLVDVSKDGTADRFDNLCNQWGLTGNYHEYAYGLESDAAGNLYVALNVSFVRGAVSPVPYRGWVVRVRPDGEMEPFCYGFRSPNGMGRNAAGDLFVTDNQGDWVPASPLYHIQKNRFYGHPASIRWSKQAIESGRDPESRERPEGLERTPPAVWMPYEELSQSATDVVCDETGGTFGPFAEQLFVGDMTKGTIVRVQLEKVDGEYQGACFLFRRGCGAVNRMAFSPEGELYLSRVNRGWGGGGRGEGLARIRFSGKTPMEIHTVTLTPNGFDVRFTKPAAKSVRVAPDEVQLEQFGYHDWGKYGSPKIDRKLLKVVDVSLSDDRRMLSIACEGLATDRVCQIQLPRLVADDGEVLLHPDAFYTVNKLRSDD